jgi:hypothetical protein
MTNNPKSGKFWFSLPHVAGLERKGLTGILFFFLMWAMYASSNHQKFFEAHQLPMLWIDTVVPFIPETFWIYISEFVLFAVVFSKIQDVISLNRYLWSFFFLQATSVLIFWVWPTTFPRGDFPLTEEVDFVTRGAFSIFRSLDDPSNCAPSLHVSSCYLSALYFWGRNTKWFLGISAWATAVAISTLTTKQHYVVDIFAAIPLTLTIYWVFYHRVEYRSRVAAPIRSDSKSLQK